jgi:hypothetical protein
MIFEMACYRGTQIWLDGQNSKTRWSCGSEGSVLTSSNLQIGPHKVKEVECIGTAWEDCKPEDGVYYVFEVAQKPEEIELRTANGTWRGPVVKVVIDDPYREEDETIVKLANGEDYMLDEVTLYLRAELTKV